VRACPQANAHEVTVRERERGILDTPESHENRPLRADAVAGVKEARGHEQQPQNHEVGDHLRPSRSGSEAA
jgi:hypothetical protein